jgi:predicted transcriptional regulator
MAQEQDKLESIKKLVYELSPETRRSLIEELTVEEFRRKVRKGFEAADRGELTPADEVFKNLKAKNASRKQEQ